MRKIQIPQEHFGTLLGRLDENLKALEKVFPVRVSARGNEIFIDGDDETEARAEDLLLKIMELLQGGYNISTSDIQTAADLLQRDPTLDLKRFFLSGRVIPSTKKAVYPKSFNQKKYIEAIQNGDLVFGVGPAGTGKTYLAMAMALSYLSNRNMSRIILARPAVEAGERFA
jgi:phosphate starvation-inducible PhoH-like protein